MLRRGAISFSLKTTLFIFLVILSGDGLTLLTPIHFTDFENFDLRKFMVEIVSGAVISPLIESIVLFGVCRVLYFFFPQTILVSSLAGLIAAFIHVYDHRTWFAVCSGVSFFFFSIAFFAWREKKKALKICFGMHSLGNTYYIIRDNIFIFN